MLLFYLHLTYWRIEMLPRFTYKLIRKFVNYFKNPVLVDSSNLPSSISNLSIIDDWKWCTVSWFHIIIKYGTIFNHPSTVQVSNTESFFSDVQNFQDRFSILPVILIIGFTICFSNDKMDDLMAFHLKKDWVSLLRTDWFIVSLYQSQFLNV